MAFTYLIGWRELDRWYYGYSSKPESDLWVRYFTSSRVVGQFRIDHGEPDVVRVHKRFETKELANDFETRFLQRVKAVKSGRWLNRHDRERFIGPSNYTVESRRKMSEAKKGKDPWNKGKRTGPQSSDVIEARVSKLRGQTRTPEQIANFKNGQARSKLDPSYKEMRSALAKKAWETKRANPNFVGPNKGKKRSPETIRKAVESRRRNREIKESLNRGDSR